MKMKHCFALILVLLVSGTSRAATGLPVGVSLERDVEYGKIDAQSLKLDVYTPQKPSFSSLPAVVWIHGGGWEKGDKSSGRDRLTPLVASGSFVGFR